MVLICTCIYIIEKKITFGLLEKTYLLRCMRTNHFFDNMSSCEDCALICSKPRKDCRKCISAKLSSTLYYIDTKLNAFEGKAGSIIAQY